MKCRFNHDHTQLCEKKEVIELALTRQYVDILKPVWFKITKIVC